MARPRLRSSRRPLVVAFAVSIGVLAVERHARADATCADAGERGVGDAIDGRIGSAERATAELATEGRRAYRWRMVWTAINSISTLAPLGAAVFVRPGLRPELVMGGLVSAASTVTTVFWPLLVESSAVRLRERAGATPCERFAATRDELGAAQEDEAARRAWPWHALNFGISATLAGVIAFGFRRYTSGALTGVSGFIAGEAQLFTQPNGLNSGLSSTQLSFANSF